MINGITAGVAGFLAAKYFKNEIKATVAFFGGSVLLGYIANGALLSKEELEKLATVRPPLFPYGAIAYAVSWGIFLKGPFSREMNYALSGASLPIAFNAFSLTLLPDTVETKNEQKEG